MATLDLYDILDNTGEATRNEAVKIREALRMLLRSFEDMHQLPRSFETKREEEERRLSERRLIHHE